MILDLQNLGTDNQRIFKGNYSGFQRYDKPKFPQATKLEEAMRGAFWNPNEVSMRDDAAKFDQMPLGVQNVMCAIWFYQTLMDSTQNRGLEETLARYVTNPEWEALFKTWGYFEMIHSLSYSHIIRGIFADSSPVFEKNFKNEQIISRVRAEAELYNQESEQDIPDGEEGVKRLIELVLTVYALEGIKFYASFLITYLIHDRYASIPGATRIIKLINFDEDTHTKASVMLLGALYDDEEFRPVIQSEWFEDKAKEVFQKVLTTEKEWADYLIGEGGMELPVSRDGVHKFLDYYTDKRLLDLGLSSGLTGQTLTPLVEWFDTYKDLNKENIALQESDMAVYNIGVMVDDL